ncbi:MULTISPECIES: MFS transporter [unclassified Curtobacterium]|uniref:MFS transporter n=1 Tax=Curtobacterium sp. MCBD17_034 TaxID=2175672 RepID=UPI0015E8AA31
MASGAFAVVLGEFVPVGALPQISTTLHVHQGVAGLLVTAPAVVGAVAAPGAAMLIRRLDRRQAIVWLTLLIAVSTVLAAIAPDFATMLVSRLLLGVSVGGVWAVSVPASARLAPAGQEHTASSVIFSAIAIGAVVAVPASTWIAATSSWRWSFVGVAVVSLLAFTAQLATVPPLPSDNALDPRHFVALVREPQITAVLLVILASVFGQFSVFTFVVPALRANTGFSAAEASLALLVFGVLTVIGNFGGAALLGRALVPVVIITFLVLAASVTLFAAAGASTIAACLALAGWGLAWGNTPVSLQVWLASRTRARAQSFEAANAAMTATTQLSIALGSFFGGVILDHAGLAGSTWTGAIALVIAFVVVVFAIATGRQRAARPETATTTIATATAAD